MKDESLATGSAVVVEAITAYREHIVGGLNGLDAMREELVKLRERESELVPLIKDAEFKLSRLNSFMWTRDVLLRLRNE